MRQALAASGDYTAFDARDTQQKEWRQNCNQNIKPNENKRQEIDDRLVRTTPKGTEFDTDIRNTGRSTESAQDIIQESA